MKIQAAPLTSKNFAPFAQVLMAEDSAPEFKPWAAKTDNLRPEAQGNMTYMSLEPAHYPIEVTKLEKHPFSNQLFVPLMNTIHLVVVCPSKPDGNPDVANAIAFHACEGQSVNYNANVWHAPRMVLRKTGSFVMIRWDAGTADDTRLLTLPQPLVVIEPNLALEIRQDSALSCKV
jgi:ureidoglycolate lyase